ncbi:hypothetical protein TDB9533_00595 [Thalassocella blandensis]|nr:hypothetical protein TDB9533_00595 [Thalassocella blandensis]
MNINIGSTPSLRSKVSHSFLHLQTKIGLVLITDILEANLPQHYLKPIFLNFIR